ncbi:MAG: tetratricopeptide repeat protein [Thainema sp.]
MRLLTLLMTTALALTLTQPAGGGQVGATQSPQKLQDAMHQTLAQTDSRQTEADRLFQQGHQQYRISQFREALQSWQQALELYRAIEDRTSEAATLNNIGIVNDLLGNYPTALDYYEQSLVITREIGDRATEAETLNNIGIVNQLLGNYPTALDYYEQSLVITREIGDRAGEAQTLNNIGTVNQLLGNYPTALDYYEQSLVIKREIGDRAGEATTLNNIGIVNDLLGNYPTALDYYEQSLVITREIGDRATEAQTLTGIGIVNQSLGNYPTALDYYEQSLVIKREIGDRAGEATTLNNIGIVNDLLGNYPTALDYYEQSLVITREIGDRATEAQTLTGIGIVNQSLGNYPTALDYYEQSLVIKREIGDRAGEATTLNNIGIVNQLLGNYPTALENYEQSLVITREIGDRASEATTLGNIGLLLSSQAQPELAIIFLKKAINGYESIRDDNRTLDTELQESYTATVEDTYRTLADLLLERGRIPEAQQVLDLLKLEELRVFTNTRAAWTGSELKYTDPEKQVIDSHSSLIALGGEVITCEDTDCAEIDSLYSQLEALTDQYNQQVEQFQETIRANRAEDDVFQDPANLSGEAEDLLTAYAQDGQQAVLIYPFVLEDKLWLVWAAAGNVIGSVEVPVTQAELSATVQRLGELLQSPQSNLESLQATSQQLYDWIIRPLETELAANDIDHLIFVNDRVTRYIPMAALYNGEQYLLERYRISTVLASGLTDTTDRLTEIDQSQVLGLGVTDAVADFNPLPAVGDELDAIIRSDAADPTGVYPGQVFLNNDFTLDALKTNVRDARVLHLATHAAFVPGRADESFILLGNGDPLKVNDIEAMHRRLSNLHMVVLSACQTALGGQAGDGTEIAGISAYFLEAGRAETVIASLWSVNDSSTSLLMQRFYQLLATGELTKAEALRQAQIALLEQDFSEIGIRDRRDDGTVIAVDRETGLPPAVSNNLSHPYYWAPFILIGNGL